MPKISLKAARINAGYTQEEFAAKLQVSKEAVIKWETGKTPIRFYHLAAYAVATGFSVDDFILPVKSEENEQVGK